MVLAVLVAGIAVQIWSAAGRAPGGDDRPALIEPLAVGDTAPALNGYGGLGNPVTVSLPNDEGTQVTVIYTFHPDCPHSRSWGREWARHFDQVQAIDSGVRRIALTVDSPSSGQGFADHFGWEVELLSVAGLSPRRRAYSLVARTPWVFVFDSDGVLRFGGHGSELEQVNAVVSRLLSSTRYSSSSERPT